MIDIRNHGGDFAGGANPLKNYPIVTVLGGHATRGGHQYSTTENRYFLAWSKSFYVSAGDQAGCVVLNRKDRKVHMSFQYVYGTIQFDYGHENRAFIVGDRYLIYAEGNNFGKLYIRDLRGGGAASPITTGIPTGNHHMKCVWYSDDGSEAYAFLQSDAGLFHTVKFDASGNVVFATRFSFTTYSPGGYVVIPIGKRGNLVYFAPGGSFRGFIAVDATTGARVIETPVLWVNEPISAFITGDMIVLHHKYNSYDYGKSIRIFRILADGSIGELLTTKENSSMTPILINGDKLLIGREAETVVPAFATDCYSITSLISPLELNVVPQAIDIALRYSQNLKEIIHTTRASAGTPYKEIGWFHTYIGRLI
ncbi:hypothetical protein [Cytobacillus firmus]|uniref:hypothetical protein n=1 Tax=Cytobacillus firmus TaxID=1399 RepID=UPI0018CFB3BC|nr:hypothetical protein [Cytobacillus firmus]MBG9655402.1 hypothetical protein [Cytobacillus firmus]MED1908536.1 hypothetical protein [Cytobacillus firmus]